MSNLLGKSFPAANLPRDGGRKLVPTITLLCLKPGGTLIVLWIGRVQLHDSYEMLAQQGRVMFHHAFLCSYYSWVVSSG